MNRILLAFLVAVCASDVCAQSAWERLDAGDMTDSSVLSITISNDKIYAGTNRDGVYVGEDLGATWHRGPSNSNFASLQIWSMTASNGRIFGGTRGGGVFELDPVTDQWATMDSVGKRNVVQALHINGDQLFAATYNGGIFIRSLTTGKSRWWNVGIDDIHALSFASNSTDLFLGTAGSNTSGDSGVFYQISLDDLQSDQPWTKLDDGFIRNGVHLEAVTALGANDEFVYAGTDDVGLYRKPTKGTTWTQVHAYTGDIHSIAAQGSTVYYGTSYGGVYLSTDDGATWQVNNSGLRFGNMTLPFLVKDLKIHEGFIYAATDLGVFRQAIAKSIVAEVIDSKRPALRKYIDEQGRLIFEFTIGEQVVRYDLLGRRV